MGVRIYKLVALPRKGVFDQESLRMAQVSQFHVSLLVSEEKIFYIMRGSRGWGGGGVSCLAGDVTDTSQRIRSRPLPPGGAVTPRDLD